MQTGSSGLVKTIKRSEILENIKLGINKPHPFYLKRLMSDSTKDEPSNIQKVLTSKLNLTCVLFESGQAILNQNIYLNLALDQFIKP